MTEKRFRVGKSILTDYPTGAIIDKKTKNRYYDGIKPSYISSKEIVEILNQYEEENEQLKQHQKNTAKEFQTLLKFIRSKGLTLIEYEEFKGDDVE